MRIHNAVTRSIESYWTLFSNRHFLVSDAAVGGLLRPWRRLGRRHVLHRLVHALGEFHVGQELLRYSPPSQGFRSRGRRGHERPHRHQRHTCRHAGNRLSECLQPLVSRSCNKLFYPVALGTRSQIVFQCTLWRLRLRHRVPAAVARVILGESKHLRLGGLLLLRTHLQTPV